MPSNYEGVEPHELETIDLSVTIPLTLHEEFMWLAVTTGFGKDMAATLLLAQALSLPNNPLELVSRLENAKRESDKRQYELAKEAAKILAAS